MIASRVNIYFFCLKIFLLVSLPAYSQINIVGRVVDEKNNQPLEAVSVFFNNTTVGSYTNADGDFHFENIRMLNTEMVIYSPGYELLVYKPSASQIEGKRILFKLQEKVPAAAAKLPLQGRERSIFIDAFRKFFLGVTDEANNCKILNESSIYITTAETDSSFYICADTSLVIENQLLGYRIIYNLEEFWYDYPTGKNHFSGYARYQEMGSNTRWMKRRDKCYYGSTLHFFRSLANHDLYQQGYGIFLVKPGNDSAALKKQETNINVLSAYANETIIQAAPQEILFIDSTNEMSINVEGTLLVQYNKNPLSKAFLVTNGFMDDLYAKGVESYIQFKKSPVGINYKGVLDDYTNIEYTGYWIYEKVANRLPLDFQPVSLK